MRDTNETQQIKLWQQKRDAVIRANSRDGAGSGPITPGFDADTEGKTRLSFNVDRFTERRSGGPQSYGNPYDPESLLTGAEVERGLGYHDHRVWLDQQTYDLARAGYLTSDEVVLLGARQKA